MPYSLIKGKDVRALRFLCTLFLAATAHAQTAATPPTAPEPNGIVTGRVFCVDTGLPARFASVSLLPVNLAKANPQKIQRHPHKTYLFHLDEFR